MSKTGFLIFSRVQILQNPVSRVNWKPYIQHQTSEFSVYYIFNDFEFVLSNFRCCMQYINDVNIAFYFHGQVMYFHSVKITACAYITIIQGINQPSKSNVNINLKTNQSKFKVWFNSWLRIIFRISTIYPSFNWIILCQLHQIIRWNWSNQAFFIRLPPSLVPSVWRTGSRWCDCAVSLEVL